MIMFELIATNMVRVAGIDTGLLSPGVWRVALERFAETLQVLISLSYSQERIMGKLALLPNSPKWTASKAKRGADVRRGHEWNRIQVVLGRVRLFGITGINSGSVTITFLEGALQQVAPHAFHYAKSKVPGGRILAVNPAWLVPAGQALRLIETRAIAEQARRLRQDPRRALIQARPVGIGRTRKLTLALTAWSVTAKVAAKLSLLRRS